MNAEQKQRAQEARQEWIDYKWSGADSDAEFEVVAIANKMAALLQELIDAPEPEPVAKVMHVDGLNYNNLLDCDLPTGTLLYTAQPAPSVPVKPMENIALNEWLDKTEWVQKELNTFPVSSLGMHRADVMRLEIDRLREMLAAPPAPSVPDEQLQAAFDRGLKAGNEQAIAQQIEIHKLHDLLAVQHPEQSDDQVRDAERYQWLKARAKKDTSYDRFGPDGCHWSIGFYGKSAQSLDAAIDAAIAAEKGEP